MGDTNFCIPIAKFVVTFSFSTVVHHDVSLLDEMVSDFAAAAVNVAVVSWSLVWRETPDVESFFYVTVRVPLNSNGSVSSNFGDSVRSV